MISYSTTITACQKGGASEEAVRLLEKMQAMQAEEVKQAAAGTTAEPGGRYKPPPVAPNAYSYTAAMSALSDAGKWEDALKTFEQAPPEMQQSEALVNAAVSAAAAGKQWRRCVELIRNLRAAGKTPQSSSFNMAIGACAAAQQPASALALLRSMRAAGVRCSLLTYNGALAAVAKAGRWRQCLRLLRRMRDDGVPPTTISYNFAIDGCAKASPPQVTGSATAATTPTATTTVSST